MSSCGRPPHLLSPANSQFRASANARKIINADCAPFKGIAGGNLGGCTASTRVHIAENMEQAAIMPDSEVMLSKGAHPHSVHASTCSVHIVHNVQRSMFVMHQTSGQVKSWVSGLRVHSMLCLTGARLEIRQR